MNRTQITRSQVTIVTLKKAAEEIGLSTKTLREKARDGFYPSTVMKKIHGSWMVDIEEWNRWHRMQS